MATVNPPTASYLLASLAGVQIALPVSSVSEILRSVALTVVPGAPPVIEGALNLRGTLLPVVDVRSLLGLPPRANAPGDSLIVLAAGSRLIAVRVDSADDVEAIAFERMQDPSALSPALASLRALVGVAPRDDGALVIYDPAAFLTGAEGDAVDAALKVAQ